MAFLRPKKPRPPEADVDTPRERTEVTLRGDGMIDLWPIARRIDARMRELGRPESSPRRPRIASIRPATDYTWFWWGDEEMFLVLACHDVVGEDNARVRYEVRRWGAARAPVAPPAAPPAPPPEPTAEELFERAEAARAREEARRAREEEEELDGEDDDGLDTSEDEWEDDEP